MIFARLWFEKRFLLRQYLPRCRLFWTFCRNFLESRFFPQPYLFILNHRWVLFSFHNIVIYKVNHVWSTRTLKRNCNWLLYVCMKLFICAGCVQNLVCIFVSFSLFQFRTRNAESPVFPNIVKASFSSVCYIIL